MSIQLPLDIMLRDEATLDRFIVANNHELIDLLNSPVSSGNSLMLYLSGVAGSGKTHLLQAYCRRFEQAVYLPLQLITGLTPDIFEGLAERPLVCLDDIHIISGHAEMELALFTLINELNENRASYLLSSNSAAQPFDFKLKDLGSRLSACAHYSLEMPNDKQKREFLLSDAHRRGLRLGEEVLNWVFTHAPRDMASLNRMMRQLDQESLRSQRRITIPFIKQVCESLNN